MEFYERNPAFDNHRMLADDQGQEITYGEFEHFYASVERRLKKRMLAFLFCENTMGAVVWYLVCLRRGMVPLLLDRWLDEGLRGQLIHRYRPDYLIGAESFFETGADTGAEDSRRGEKASEASDYDAAELNGFGYAVWSRKHAEPAADRLHPDLALLLMTSGSTGSPKLVRQSYGNLAANSRSIAGYLRLTETERPITTLPMHYTYGLSVIQSHLLVGATVLLTKQSMLDLGFWDFFRRESATSFAGVPYTYQMLKRLDFFDMELPSLRTMTQAGGKLPEHLHLEFARYAASAGRSFVVMYGQTEATARMSYLPAQDALQKCGSIGIPVPGGKFRIMEEQSTEITAPETVGELVYEGPNVAMGYAQTPEELSRGDEWKGCLFTGDMAKRDQDGYYYIVGRKKRFLKMYGKRVSLDEVEGLLRERYREADTACTGRDDAMDIYVCGAEGISCEEIRIWICRKTGLHVSRVRVIRVGSLPRSKAGKIAYELLKSYR